MADTKISWATKVYNPVTGCTKISEGCRNCYAERMSKRLAGAIEGLEAVRVEVQNMKYRRER